LKFFLDYDDDVISNFVSIAFEHIYGNFRNKAYSSAAQKLGTDPTTIELVISKLVFVLLESARLQLLESEFLACCESILPSSKAMIMWNGLNHEREKLTEVLSKTGINHPHYTSLDWRLESTIASRTLKKRNEIKVDLSLNLKQREGVVLHKLSTDIPNLLHMTQVLEAALFETKSSHIRKVQRAFK